MFRVRVLELARSSKTEFHRQIYEVPQRVEIDDFSDLLEKRKGRPVPFGSAAALNESHELCSVVLQLLVTYLITLMWY